MSAVIADTNIFIRAFLSKKFQEDAILRKIFRGGYKFLYGKDQIKEFVEVLGYDRLKKHYQIDRDDIGEFIKFIVKKGKQVEAESCNLCRDPDDNYILGLAIRASKREKVWLVTGDKDILALKKKIKGVQILTAGEFVKKYSPLRS